DAGRIGELLRPLEFELAEADESGTWEVAVPPHRLDVVEAVDVAEEIARAHGYPLIPGRLPRAALPPYRADPSEVRHRVRRIMAGLGLSEVVTHALIAFFCQAEDGIRAGTVTGVQTCALPIFFSGPATKYPASESAMKFSISVEMISLALKRARSQPAMPPQMPPPTMPRSSSTLITSHP